MNNSEKYIFETIVYIEEITKEFGILHPLVDKTLNDLCEYIKHAIDNGLRLSESSSLMLARRLEKILARKEKAIEDQKRLAEKESKVSFTRALFGGVLVIGVAAFIYRCFRKDDPIEMLHHHSGSITDNININHSGHVTEDINLWLHKF